MTSTICPQTLRGHHYRLAEPNGPIVGGRCIDCGESRTWRSAQEDMAPDELRLPPHIRGTSWRHL